MAKTKQHKYELVIEIRQRRRKRPRQIGTTYDTITAMIVGDDLPSVVSKAKKALSSSSTQWFLKAMKKE